MIANNTSSPRVPRSADYAAALKEAEALRADFDAVAGTLERYTARLVAWNYLNRALPGGEKLSANKARTHTAVAEIEGAVDELRQSLELVTMQLAAATKSLRGLEAQALAAVLRDGRQPGGAA